MDCSIPQRYAGAETNNRRNVPQALGGEEVGDGALTKTVADGGIRGALAVLAADIVLPKYAPPRTRAHRLYLAHSMRETLGHVPAL